MRRFSSIFEPRQISGSSTFGRQLKRLREFEDRQGGLYVRGVGALDLGQGLFEGGQFVAEGDQFGVERGRMGARHRS